MERTASRLSSSVESVISNDDLLTEILVRLPVLSLVLFKSVSKRWLSLIKDANVTFRRKLDPVSGLILEKYSLVYDTSYDFVPLDNRIGVCRSYVLTTKESTVDILDSCNGLLFCRTFNDGKYYVYNPSITNMFTAIPEPDNVTRFNNFSAGGLKMAFDPTKSPTIKLFMVNLLKNGYGVYWNDAIYWLNGGDEFFKLDIMNEHPVLTTLQTPLTLDRKVHYECRLFESRGCLLLVGKDNSLSRHFTIYEKGNVYSEWSVKYIVNLDDIIKPFSEWWSIEGIINCIVLGEREEDSFLVMELDKKVVQYKIVPKTLTKISDLDEFFLDDYPLEEADIDENPVSEELGRCFQFITSFANV